MFKVFPHEPKTVSEWFNDQNSLNLNPKYQRKSHLWSKDKQAGLIDSILNDYDVPKFYLADFRSFASPLNTAKTKYAVIDGKQRLLALFGFFTGEVKLSKKFVLIETNSTEYAGLDFLNLKRRSRLLAEKFEEFRLDVISVVTDDPIRIEELFVRLNFGVAVNGAERRNAMPGRVPELIRLLVLHPFFEKNISFGTQRMAEYNVAAKILYLEHRRAFADTKAANLDRFVERMSGDQPEEVQNAYARAVKVLTDMHSVFRERDSLLSSGGGIPLYYWLVREHSDVLQFIRDFLEEFLGSVKKNLEISRIDPEAADSELSSYYTMGRTTNDQASLAGRFEILERRFASFLSSKSQNS